MNAVDEVAAAAAVVRRARNEIGRPLIYVTIIGRDARVPNAAERAALNNFTEQIIDCLEVAFLVIEGDSLKHRLQRTMMTGILMFAQARRVRTTVHRTTGELVGEISRRIGRDSDYVMEHLKAPVA